MWRHLIPHDAPRPWQSKVMAGRVSLKMGGSRWCQPLSDVHGIGGLMADCLCMDLIACVKVGLGCMRMCKQMLCAKAWASGC